MKQLKIDFYNVKEKLYFCEGCGKNISEASCPECDRSDCVEMISPKIGQDIIIAGAKDYDVITYYGLAFPVWVEWWGHLNLKPL